ncbi:hypothetical protein V8B97DRAFT_1866846 [Scleroderma yunnanense]
MPPSTRPATPGPSSPPQVHKRHAADIDPFSRKTKKQRISPSPETHAQRDCNRDNKRRRKKKKKVPVVTVGGFIKNDVATEGSGGQYTRTLPNEIIRFASMPAEAELSSTTCSSMAATPILPVPAAPVSLAVPVPGGNTVDAGVAGTTVSPRLNGTDGVLKERGRSTPSLEDRVTQLTQELATKNELLKSHQALLTQVQQAITCQICLELMHKPFALSPCGHLACYDCLVQWFKAPPADNRPAGPVIMRQKTCPHCRGVVRERPIEVWGVKGIVQSVAKSNLVPSHLSAPTNPPEPQNANTDPWSGIFPKVHQRSRRTYPWFVSVDDGDEPHPGPAPRGEDMGMLDMEDGGIYRCFDCMHEIWDGVCTSCGRLYPGHRPNPDDDDIHREWLERESVAEDVDVDDGPVWMGLEGGDGDDVGDDEDDNPLFGPWLWADRGIGMGMVDPVRFYHDLSDDYGDEDDVGDAADYGIEDDGAPNSDGSNNYDEDDDRYESDFIDDEVEAPEAPHGAEIYEISDSGGEDDRDYDHDGEGDYSD